jgi:alkanesulfonate monooxygenase SsuD/methylene tetrahydromethanopterin reductase-like flavin-dependent oxidoreductase (luciferase family)
LQHNPFPPTAERFERLEETLQIAHQMWAGDQKPYQGKHYQLGRPLNVPAAVQKPHPPILIGGAGERKTLRLVAQYGDACNLSLRLGKDEVQRKLGVLRAHCQAVGRPYIDIAKTTLGTIRITRDGRENSLTPAAAITSFRELAAMGIDQAIVNMPNVTDLEPFDLLATEILCRTVS